MPAATYSDEDDPVIASYDVYITKPGPEEPRISSNIYVLQYSSHRTSAVPYNAAHSQNPRALRLKPQSGVLEVDVPILTTYHYNEVNGLKYGNAMADSRINQSGGSHGLAGGFGHGPTQSHNINIHDLPAHDRNEDPHLRTQTIGGKMVIPTSKDPVYMLGSFHNQELHLTHLNGVIQMRPQLHHIDAEEEVNQKKFQISSTLPGAKAKQGLDAPPGKLETKAIELKLKDNKEDMKDRNLNSNAKLLREIQTEDFKLHSWVDEADPEALDKFQKTMHPRFASRVPGQTSEVSNTELKSVFDNDEWLDKMSSPAMELRTRLKGRDRERARRKRQERLRQVRVVTGTSAVAETGNISESDDSSSEEEHRNDITEPVDTRAALPVEAEIKQDPEALAPTELASSPDEPKKRGRPKKTVAVTTSTSEF